MTITSDILDIGCGHRKLTGAFGMDLLPLPGIDLVHNLDEQPWPLPDGHFRWVRAIDVLEHVDDFVGCMQECHRVLKPGGRLTIKMPFAGSVHHHTDPTHRRSATSRSLDYFCQKSDSPLRDYDYTGSLFELNAFHYVREIPVKPPLGPVIGLLDKRLLPLLERHHDVYEHYFTGLYPVHSILFECTRL